MDPVVKKHFNSLSERMLEKDLCRLIEPYSYVQIQHIASEINIDRAKVSRLYKIFRTLKLGGKEAGADDSGQEIQRLAASGRRYAYRL